MPLENRRKLGNAHTLESAEREPPSLCQISCEKLCPFSLLSPRGNFIPWSEESEKQGELFCAEMSALAVV